MYKNKYSSLIILIPAFNEKRNFQKFILKLKKKYKVFVIDDCSKDGTHNFLKKKKINFLRNKKNLGYESSLIKGFSIIKKDRKIKYILTMDGDGQHDLKFIQNIFDFTIKNNLDVAIGERYKKNRIIEILISKVFNIKYKLNDPLSGFKIYKKEKINQVNFFNIKKFFLVDLLIFLIKKKINIKNYKIVTNVRTDNPRVGNLFSIYFKMIKILTYVLFK